MYKVIFINLDRRFIRRRQMELQLLSQNIPFKRIAGVNSGNITEELHGEIRKNVIARELAHINARDYIINQNDKTNYIIMEDDMVICDDFINKLGNITNCMLFSGMKAYVIDRSYALLLNNRLIGLDYNNIDLFSNNNNDGDVSCDNLTVYDNFEFIKGRDSYGNDIVWEKGKTERELIDIANSYDYCMAFNSYGFMKYKLDYLDRFVYLSDHEIGIYIKRNNPLTKSYYDFVKNKDAYDNYLLKNNESDAQTHSILKELIISNLPKINNLKKEITDLINLDDISDPNGISIVMTTHDRVTQTLFTLDTIAKYAVNRNIQVILIDDSDELIDKSILDKYPFLISYVTLQSKSWINPCINYAIGFNVIKYDNVIIQNAEVCHIGDVIGHVMDNLQNNQYMVFDVACTPDITYNEPLYKLDSHDYKTTYLHVLQNNYNWYQHHLEINKKYHFMTAIKRQDLVRIGGFDYDYAYGACFDDTDFIYQIENYHKLDIKIIKHYKYNLMGIHLFHEKSKDNKAYTNDQMIINKYLFQLKCKYHQLYGKPIKLYELDEQHARSVFEHMQNHF